MAVLQLNINAVGASYDDVIYALRTVSRILASNDFAVMYTCVAVLAVFICLMSTAFSAFYTRKQNFNWFISILVIAPIFWASLIRSHADVLVYNADKNDEKFGQFIPIRDVPLGVALPAWLYSYAEELMRNMVGEHAAPLYTYDLYDGTDYGYKTLINIHSIPQIVNAAVPKVASDMRDYTRGCIAPGVARGLIDIKKLTKIESGSELWDFLKYPEKNGNVIPAGGTTCNALHDRIKVNFKSNSENIIKAYCDEINMPFATCSKKLEYLARGNMDTSKENYVFSYYVAAIVKMMAINSVKANANAVDSYLVQADKQANVSNVTGAFQAEKWLVKLRSSTFVIVLLLAPVCFLLVFFAPGGVFKWYGGMYVWLIIWASIDQLLLMKYQNDIYEAYKSIRASGLGLLNVLDAGAVPLEHLGMYGKMRWMGMTLALAMCMGILKIGNHAMANIAGSMGQAFQSAGEQAGAKLGQAGGTAAATEQIVREQARGWAAGLYDVPTIANQE